jgi:hypothetical protein
MMLRKYIRYQMKTNYFNECYGLDYIIKQKATTKVIVYNIISFPYVLILYLLNLFFILYGSLAITMAIVIITIPIDLLLFLFVKRKWPTTKGFYDFFGLILMAESIRFIIPYDISINGYRGFKREEKERKERNLITLTTQELLEYHSKLIEQGGTLYD